MLSNFLYLISRTAVLQCSRAGGGLVTDSTSTPPHYCTVKCIWLCNICCWSGRVSCDKVLAGLHNSQPPARCNSPYPLVAVIVSDIGGPAMREVRQEVGGAVLGCCCSAVTSSQAWRWLPTATVPEKASARHTPGRGCHYWKGGGMVRSPSSRSAAATATNTVTLTTRFQSP